VYELKGADELGIPAGILSGASVTHKEIDMALRLVEDMTEKWQPEKFRDTYRDDLMARIEEKVRQGQTEEITMPERAGKAVEAGGEVIDLMALLKKSVERRQDKPAKRAAKGKRHAA
jgi:DNA end-binding protein Ku